MKNIITIAVIDTVVLLILYDSFDVMKVRVLSHIHGANLDWTRLNLSKHAHANLGTALCHSCCVSVWRFRVLFT